MASKWPPVKNASFTFVVYLRQQADTKLIKTTPTIAAGDFKVSTDGAAIANPATLPSESPAGSGRVLITLSASEMNGDDIWVRASDAAGSEWCDEAWNIHTVDVLFNDIPTAGENADAVWDEALAGHAGAGSAGAELDLVSALPTAAAAAAAVVAALAPVSGTAQAGGASTIQLAAGASAVDSFYNNMVVLIVGGTGAGQARQVLSYVGATRTATLTGSWGTNPDLTSKYIIVVS